MKGAAQTMILAWPVESAKSTCMSAPPSRKTQGALRIVTACLAQGEHTMTERSADGPACARPGTRPPMPAAVGGGALSHVRCKSSKVNFAGSETLRPILGRRADCANTEDFCECGPPSRAPTTMEPR